MISGHSTYLEDVPPLEQLNLLRLRLQRQPEKVDDWLAMGQLLLNGGDMEEAVYAFNQAANLQPSNASILTALGTAYWEMSRPDEAIIYFEKALVLHPNEILLRLNHLFVLPIIPESQEQTDRLRRRCIDGVEQLLKMNIEYEMNHHSTFSHTFYLMYEQHDNRDLLEKYGSLLSSVIDPYPFGQVVPKPAIKRIRIGFLSAFFCEHSNARAFEGWIRHLDRKRFELVLVHFHDRRKDAFSDRLDSYAEQVVTLSASLPEAQEQIKNLELDVLFYTDIGMHSMTSMLASSRLAPMQVTGWGIPQTSGMTMIDYYISGSLVETENSDSQYTEQLIRVPGLPCCYLDDDFLFTPRSRDHFFLPNDAPLIGCPQNLWKLPPGFDYTLEKIANRVPESWFVFIEAEEDYYNQKFADRLRNSAPNVYSRLILLPRLNRKEFMALVSELDLLLDPPNFSSGVTLFDVLHTGTPFVAMKGPYLRSCFVAGAYRLIGLEKAPIATDLDDYVDQVEHLLRNPQELAKLKSSIAELARQRLYNRLEGLRAFEDFVWEAMKQLQAASSLGS